MSNGPTPTQIAQVQANLKNMQAFNDFVYNQGNSRVLNAYLLLSEHDNSDPGLTVGLNILEGVFWAIGSEFGPAGNFFASFCSGMVAWWATETPPSLNTTFANLLIRLQNTSLAVDTQLATYYDDVAKYWNTQFTYNGQTETLSSLANITIPAETDTQFEVMAKAAIFAMDQQVWITVMQANYVITFWQPTRGVILPGDQNNPPVAWDEMFIGRNPAYYNTWVWHASLGCGDDQGWAIMQYNIGTGVQAFSDGSMGNDACAYLFIDSADGVVINKNGLFSRKTVFTGLGIKQVSYFVGAGGGGAVSEKLSVGYLRAMKEGKTLGLLLQSEGREQVANRVILKAQEDSVFAVELTLRPRQTLEKFLDVKIPEVVSLSVVVEDSGTFGLVVPRRTN